MASDYQERYEKFQSAFVDEFEMHVELQRIIMEDATTKSEKVQGIFMGALKEVFTSVQGLVGKTLGGIKNYVMDEKKLDMAGKLIKLVNKYENPEEKKAIRAMLVRVADELFLAFEYQFMIADLTRGGSSQAMVQLARTCVWSFMHCYKFDEREELDVPYFLEAITLKNKPSVNFWQKLYYKDEKKFTEVTNTEDQKKYDSVKIFSKAGIAILENQKLVFYKNDVTKPEKYNFRRIFSHENNETIKKEFTEEVKEHPQMKYNYILNLGTVSQEERCAKMLEKINFEDKKLMEKRLEENMPRITKNIAENLVCETMGQVRAILNEISLPPAATSSVVNNETTVNKDFVCKTQNAKKIKNSKNAVYKNTVQIKY